MLKKLNEFLKDEDGLTALEYAIAGGVITAGLVTFIGTIGDNANTLMGNLDTAVSGAVPSTN